MKKKSISLNKALSLDKETIAQLNEDQLGDVVGGTGTCNGGGIQQEQADIAGTIHSCQACSCNG